ncbi:hypothetical protein BH24ACT5_BH24ACT5_04500 [soil metagenome]
MAHVSKRRAADTADTMADLVGRVDRWIAIEELLFTTLGRWAVAVPEPAAKRSLATWCHRHAWHASLWRERRPTHDGAGRPDIAEGDDDWLAPLRRTLSADGVAERAPTPDKLAVLIDVMLSALDDAVVDHAGAIDERLDGPTARVLALVATDLAAERRELAGLLAGR